MRRTFLYSVLASTLSCTVTDSVMLNCAEYGAGNTALYKCVAYISEACTCDSWIEQNPYVQNGGVIARSSSYATDCWQRYWLERDPGLFYVECRYVQPWTIGEQPNDADIDVESEEQ